MRRISASAGLFKELMGLEPQDLVLPTLPCVCKKKKKSHMCSDTVRQHLHFISDSENIYLQFYHSIAPSKLKSNITAAASFCCFCKKRSSEEAVCWDPGYQDFKSNQMTLSTFQGALFLYGEKEKNHVHTSFS